MNFGDLLSGHKLILVVCHDCGAQTPLDPGPPAMRLGLETDAADIKADMHCPACGAAEISLAAFSPVGDRDATLLA